MKVLIYIFGKKSQLGVICFLICLSLFFTACSRQKDDKLPLLLLGLYSNPNATQTCETNPERCELSTFTSAAAPSSKTWAAVTFGGNQFVSVAQDAALTNSVMTSPDAKTWTERTAGDSEQWLGVAYGNNIFVALANSGTTNRAMTSTDGINWIMRSLPGGGGVNWTNLLFENGRFVAISTASIATSTNGIDWTSVAPPAAGYEGIAYGNGVFVIVASGGQVATSTDAVNWTTRTAAQTNDWRAVTFGKNTFVAVARSGTNRVMSSSDGINWTARSAAENNEWYGVQYGNGLFMAASFSGTSRAMTSTDGINWTARTPLSTGQYRGVAYGNGAFVLVSISGSASNQVQYATWAIR